MLFCPFFCIDQSLTADKIGIGFPRIFFYSVSPFFRLRSKRTAILLVPFSIIVNNRFYHTVMGQLIKGGSATALFLPHQTADELAYHFVVQATAFSAWLLGDHIASFAVNN